MMEFGLLKENMINMMRIKTIILVWITLCGFNISAQDNFGGDEQKCKKIYQCFENIINRKITLMLILLGYGHLLIVPASQNIYKNGPKIIKQKIKENQEYRSAYIDTLMMVFDQRIKYFGKEGYVLGLKGYELVEA